jgi:hypothetical protein
MAKPIIYYNNALRDAQKGDDGTTYATCPQAYAFPGDDFKALGVVTKATDIAALSALVGSQLVFNATLNRYNIIAIGTYPGVNPQNIRLRSVCYSGTLLVAVGIGDGVDSYIVTSPDGRVWTVRAPTVAKNIALYGVCWSGTQFCAVGAADGTDSYILTSPDGIIWTERAPTVPKNIFLTSVTWSSALSLFSAVGQADGTDSYILTSPDGISWTERAPTVAKNISLYGVVWSGTLFVAVGGADGTDSYILTSADGTTWTERAPTVAKNIDLNGICWSGSLFVAVGADDGGDAYIVTSTDGTTWTERANAKRFILYSVAWSGSTFMAVGEADGSNAYMLTSTDGTTWVEKNNPQNFSLYGVTYFNGFFIAVGEADGVDAYIVITADGIFYPDTVISLFESLQTADVNTAFSIKAGLTCAQQDTIRVAPYAADNSLSPVMKGLVNTTFYLRAHAPNFLQDGGFESGAFSPNWTAGADWAIETVAPLEGAKSAAWNLAGSTPLYQSSTKRLEKGVTYRLLFTAKSVTANPTVGAVRVQLVQTLTATYLDVAHSYLEPAITTTATWFYTDITPDFSTDNWALYIITDNSKANGASKVIVDEFYLYQKMELNTLIIGRHNLSGKLAAGNLEVRSYKMSPLRSTVGASDYSTLASFTITTADVFSQALTSAYDPVVELMISAEASLTPELGEVYIGNAYTFTHYPQAPLDPWRINAEGLRDLTLQFSILAPALRTTTIRDIFARLKANESVWLKWDTDPPILMQSPQDAREAAFNPYRVGLALHLVEVV